MIEQCEKCALYNSLGCPYCGSSDTDSWNCDEYRPNEESKITDPIKRRLFNLLKDSPSLNVLYEEQWTESVEYLVSNGVTIKSEIAEDIFNRLNDRLDYYRRYAEVNPLIATFLQIIDDVRKEYTEGEGEK